MLGKIQLCGTGMELDQWTLSRRGVQLALCSVGCRCPRDSKAARLGGAHRGDDSYLS
jgi:hypothetical protein